MIKFLLYLFETGLCLSTFYAVYYFFLRKETFFNFNRIYLIGIMFLSLSIPLLHINIVVRHTDQIHEPIQEIGKLRSYYTDFFSLADEDFVFGRQRKYKAAVFEENDLYSYADPKQKGGFLSGSGIGLDGTTKEHSSNNKNIKLAEVILMAYFAGVFVFFIRLMVLLFWLGKTIRSNPQSKTEGYSLIQLKKEIPPFSFFRYIFVTKEATALNEFEQVLAHEKVHVKQRHSVDLLVAHVVSVFQWFNPLVWKLQKALKITHEYIADSNVVSQGFKLFDYQSLLLNQLISVKSVELINNFNLLSIKKRIAMMTKNKSGFLAKMKILLVIPAAIAIFFLFSYMTVQSPAFSFSNYGISKTSNLDGIWENPSSQTFGKLLYFNGNNLSVLENSKEVTVIDLKVNITDKVLKLNGYGGQEESLKYELAGGELKIWWGENETSVYKKTNYSSSLEAFIPKQFGNIELPTIKESRVLEKQGYIYNIYVYNDKYFVENVQCSLSQLKETLQKRVSQFRIIDKPYLTAKIHVDKNTVMKPVYDLFQILRELQLYKIAYAALPSDNTSKLQYHATAIPKKLPPIDAMLLTKEEVKDRLFEFLSTDNLKTKSSEMESFIKSHPDFIICVGWGNSTKYGDFIASVDMTHSVFYKLRDGFTLEKYGIKYAELPLDLQNEAKMKYPMRVTQYNFDEE